MAQIEEKLEDRALVIDNELKIVAFALIGATAILAIYPTLSDAIIVEPFSELGLLGPDGKIGDYPQSVVAGEPFNLIIYVGCHEGISEYYRVQVKVGDQATNLGSDQPLSVDPIYSWDILLINGRNVTFPVSLVLNEPGINKRLVIELNMFEPKTDDFVFKSGVQLWVNVTKTS